MKKFDCEGYGEVHQVALFLLCHQEAATLLRIESPASVVFWRLRHNFHRCNFKLRDGRCFTNRGSVFYRCGKKAEVYWYVFIDVS